MLAPLIDMTSGPEGRKILWNDALESSFKELKRVVYAKMVLSYPYYKMPFTVHTGVFDKQLGGVISHNNTPIAFFLIRFIKPRRNYTKTEKELLVIVEFLKKFRGIIFGC